MATILPLVESFHSIQGEGAHVGKSAFFIRLAGCNVGCPWCDTKNSWNTSQHKKYSVDELAQQTTQAIAKGANFVVLTGGEPLHYDLKLLCQAIRKATTYTNKESTPIHLETSGVNAITGHPDWITLSPKRHSPPRSELLAACQELKIVVNDEGDLTFAEQMAHQAITEKQSFLEASHKKQIKPPLLFLQPGWQNLKGLNLAIEYVVHHPNWRLSMQTHKWLGIR